MWTRNNLRKRLVGIVVIAMICLISIAVFLSHHQKVGKEMTTPLMDPRPGELFYYTFWYGFDSPPKIDRSSITDYDGLIWSLLIEERGWMTKAGLSTTSYGRGNVRRSRMIW